MRGLHAIECDSGPNRLPMLPRTTRGAAHGQPRSFSSVPTVHASHPTSAAN
jgi:hypothetical protein